MNDIWFTVDMEFSTTCSKASVKYSKGEGAANPQKNPIHFHYSLVYKPLGRLTLDIDTVDECFTRSSTYTDQCATK